jgi:hypothetical protein
MRLAPYAEFGRLRLAHWCPDDPFLEEVDRHYRLIHERLCGVSFFRSMEHPDQTLSIDLELLNLHENLRSEILSLIGLPLAPGDSVDKVKSILGEPDVTRHSHLNRYSWLEFNTDQPDPYRVSCAIRDNEGLSQITVQRLDIPFPLSQEELDAPPSEHRRLDMFEASPENVKSPESPVSRVSICLESSGMHRYVVHIRNQMGVVIQGVSFHAPSVEPKIGGLMLQLRIPEPDPNGKTVLDGYLDRDLVRRSHLRLDLLDELNHTSQTVVVEFERFWGL